MSEDWRDRAMTKQLQDLAEAWSTIGSLTYIMESALSDIKHGCIEHAARTLETRLNEYNKQRDAALVKLGLSPRRKPVPTMVVEPNYDDKHSDAFETDNEPPSPE